MIELFSPIAGFASPYDGWQVVGLPGNGPGSTTDAGATTHAGPRVFNALANPAQGIYAGHELGAFGRDLYDRIHISVVNLDLGNVIGLQERAVSVWNAYRRNQPLASLTEDNAEGLDLTGQPAPPIDFAVLQQRIYTLTVSTDGPPTIDATYTWDFAPYDLVLRVTGSRVTAWSFIPDWSNPIIERMEWKTDILRSYDGSEQSRSARIGPRKTYEFEAFFTDKSRRYAESIVWGWGARSWALPIWPDGLDLPQAALAGDTSIALDTTTRDYEADGLAIILGDAFTFEVVEIDSVSADAIELKRPLSATWAAGTRIYPARLARLQPSVRLPRWDGDASGSRLSFDLVETVDHAASAGATLYRSYPVLTRRPEWSGGFDIELQRKLATLDSLTGGRAFEDESGAPSTLQSMRWTWTNRAEQDAYRSLLYALRGRHARLWVPTWTKDLQLAAVIGSSATNIDIEFCAYTKQIAQAPNRRDIRIELWNGAVYYRRITGSQDIGGGLERLGIDSALGAQVEVADVAMISFIALCRLDQDAIELAHWTGEVCDSTTVFRGVRHDV